MVKHGQCTHIVNDAALLSGALCPAPALRLEVPQCRGNVLSDGSFLRSSSVHHSPVDVLAGSWAVGVLVAPPMLLLLVFLFVFLFITFAIAVTIV
jgi:hypothetical protein